MHKHYLIKGDLTRCVKIFDEDRRRIWDSMAEFRTRVAIELINQHNSHTMFTGPIGINCNFYLLYPKDVGVKKRVDHAVHTRLPPISSLIYFLEHLGFGILFGNTSKIVEVNCKKIFTLKDPRVEFEIYNK